MENIIEINEKLAKRVKDTVSYGLCKGLGKPNLGEMCIEAAVNYACGLPHGDNPSCVGIAVRAFKIRLNDSRWSSNEARAKGMLKIAIAQLGSNTINQVEFSKIVAFKTITILMPIILRIKGYEDKAVLCENSKDLEIATDNIKLVRSKLYAYAADAAAAAADGAADGAADAAAYAAAAAADVAADADKYLIISANICLDALIELKSPGCEFLYLCNE